MKFFESEVKYAASGNMVNANKNQIYREQLNLKWENSMSSNIQITRKCINCKKNFIAKKTTTRYCSHHCNQIHYKKQQTKDKIATASRNISIPKNDRTWLTIPESASMLGISERTIFRLIAKNEIQPLKIGRRVIIPKTEIIKI